MNTLPTFKNNETKMFKFTNEQYYRLEIEYNRYVYYKSLIKQFEKILNITEITDYNNTNNNNTNNNRKKYENKNIIDRFILECINHGITPYIEHKEHEEHIDQNINKNINLNINANINANIDHKLEINFDTLSNYLFFNNTLDNAINLQNTIYYKKMISEYNEKKIRITPEKLLQINKAIVDSNKQFKQFQIESNSNLNMYKNKKNSRYISISCSITLQNNEYFIIKYRDYFKIININRYYKLIKNYDKPYPFDIIKMLLRYSIFDMSSQQWSIGDNLYEDISEIFNISFEMFASPLNFNMNMFCSIFYDTDHIFGSIGSFYSLDVDKFLNQNIKGVFFNPPYLPLLMNNSTKQCLKLLDNMNKIDKDFTVVSFLPNWDDAEYIKNFVNSKYTVSTRIVSKGNYILHEKDKGKFINGTFDLLVIVLNSIKSNWDNEKKKYTIDGINKIVEIMKIESREVFIRK
jgi:hypothetical protein